MAARGPTGQHDRSVDPMRRAVRSQPVQRGIDLRHNLRQRGIRRQGIARQGRRPAARVGAGDQIGELLLAVALPVPAVNEDDARRIRIGLRKQVPGVALSLAVAQVQMHPVGRAEHRGRNLARRVQHRTVGDMFRVVIGGVAFGLAEEGPFGVDAHAVAVLYQSMICRPCQNNAPGRPAMCSKARSNQPIRCGTPLM